MRISFILLLLFNFFGAHSQIDLQTGSAQYSIPVFSYSDPKSGLSHAVAINYNSGQGIKVNQLSSNIGLGWSLMAGGEIIRIQRGSAPDDQYNPDATYNGLNSTQVTSMIFYQDNPTLFNAAYPNGFLYKKYDINYLPKQLAFQPRFGDNEDPRYKMAPEADEDTEQDRFMVNIDGEIKEFVIGKNLSIQYEDNTLWKTSIITEDISDRTLYNQNIITKIKGFTITNEEGIKYTFDKYDLDEMQQATDQHLVYLSSKQIGTGKYVISKWLLTSITNTITNTSITFTYTQEDHQYFSDLFDQTTASATNDGSPPPLSNSELIGNSHTKTNVLQQITFPNNTYVTFTLGSTTRIDVNGSFPLSRINVNNGSSIVKTVTINSAYFYGKTITNGTGINPLNPSDIYASAIFENGKYRLALTGVNITGLSPSTYSFTYFTGAEYPSNSSYLIPSRMSKQRDYSGLYNTNWYGIGGVITTPQNSDADPAGDGYSEKLGLLKDIQLSTNSTISYDYKLWGLQTFKRRAMLVDRITYTDAVTNTTYAKAYGYCGGGSNSYNCSIISNNIPRAFTVYDDASLGTPIAGTQGQNYENDHIQYNLSTSKKFGYYIHYTSSSELITIAKAEIVEVVDAYLSGIVSEIVDNNPYAAVVLIIAEQLVSSAINSLDAWLENIFGGGVQNYDITVYYDHLLEEGNPLPTALAHVCEFNIINGTPVISKEYQYTTSNFSNKVVDYDNNNQAIYPITAFSPSGMQRSKPGLLGNLAQVNYFDQQGNTIYNKTLSYTPSYQTLDNNFLSVYYKTNTFYSATRDHTPYADNTIPDSWINKTVYNYTTGRSFVSSTTETLANSANSANSTSTVNYSYDTKNNLPNQAYSTASDGKVKGSNSYYAVDYWNTYISNTVLSKQKLNNMVNVPVATVSWFKTSAASTSYNVTSVTITDYDPATLKVNSIKTSLLSQPVALLQTDLNSFDPYSTSTSWLSSVTFTYLQQNTYDNNYMLVQANLNDNSSVNSVVYDYNTYLPSAKISNATYTDVSYSSFESTNKDFLSYADAGVIADATSVTGNYLYNLSAGNVTRTLAFNSSQNYQVTLWEKNGTVTVNGSSGTSLVTKNGWTLYKFTFTGTTSLAIAGTAYIDELRIYPANAQMNTCTYKPLIGIASSCDENNNTSYNVYDDAGRLILVMDANKNIIKKMCYNNLYASTACTDYGNAAQTGFFYGSCGCTFSNNGVPYTVSANKYHSAISQAAADAQAWAEINANGQTNANNHPSCSALNTQTVQYVNSTSDQLCVTITNKCTNQVTTYNLSASVKTATTITQLAAATYNIEIKNCSNQNVHSYMVNNYTITGTNDATFYNMQFFGSVTFVIY